MPAPAAQMMQQLARAKFMTFKITVPPNWKPPVGNTAAKHYGDAHSPSDHNTVPGTPPLFVPASLNKHHTDTQKMLIAKFGGFIDRMCSAICSGWSQWQSAASMVGVIVNAVTAAGGQIVGPPLMPLIMASAPKATPMELKYSTVIATVIGTAWQSFTATVKIPGLPFYPAFASVPSAVAPPMPNVPVPFAALAQVPVSISCQMMKTQMIAKLGEPMAPFHKELFESLCDAFEKSYDQWKVSTQVTNVIGTGPTTYVAVPVPTAGAVVGGTAQMPPGGFV